MATKYFRGPTTSTLVYSTASSWSLSSGGAANTTIPTISDDIIFDSNSAKCTVSANSHAKTLTLTGYTGIITINANRNLSVLGSVTLGTSGTWVSLGTSTTLGFLGIVGDSSTFTANITNSGNVFGCAVVFGNNSDANNYTYTLLDDCTFNNLVFFSTNSNSTPIITFNGHRLFVKAAITVQNEINGTTKMVFSGNTTLSNSFSSPTNIDVDINTTGTFDCTSALTFGTNSGQPYVPTLTYVAGTVVGDLFTFGECNIDTSGMTWNNVTASDINILTTLNATTMNVSSAAVNGILGPAGFICDTLICNQPGSTIILGSGITYSVDDIIFAGALGSEASISASTPGTQIILNINNSTAGKMIYTDAIDVDSSGGQPCYTYKGILSNTKNWNSVNIPSTISHTFVK